MLLDISIFIDISYQIDAENHFWKSTQKQVEHQDPTQKRQLWQPGTEYKCSESTLVQISENERVIGSQKEQAKGVTHTRSHAQKHQRSAGDSSANAHAVYAPSSYCYNSIKSYEKLMEPLTRSGDSSSDWTYSQFLTACHFLKRQRLLKSRGRTQLKPKERWKNSECMDASMQSSSAWERCWLHTATQVLFLQLQNCGGIVQK